MREKRREREYNGPELMVYYNEVVSKLPSSQFGLKPSANLYTDTI